jgi:tRNA(Ile)-lysidine synthase
MAVLAREEETWWEAEVARIAAPIVLPGRPVRGGGRAAGQGLAIEVARLAELPVALQRRLLRHAAEQLGAAPDFDGTEALRNLALTGRAAQKCELAGGLRGERTHREIRLTAGQGESSGGPDPETVFTIEVPGEISAPEWGIRVRIAASARSDDSQPLGRVVLRPWKPGDRVRLRHSGGPRKVKEVLERMHVTGSARANWPVLEVAGRILWMQGVLLEPEPGIEVTVSALDAAGPEPRQPRISAPE